MLTITNLTYRISGRLLLEGASAVIPRGAKVGLVGKNGTGKSTLFRLICGETSPESGEIDIGKALKIGRIAQEAPGDERSLMATVLEADTERSALLAEAETATDGMRIAEIHARLNDIDAHSAEARAGAILTGLGFDAAAQQRPCSAFSGGWRMRVALASLLFTEPDLLLLDEPTNYLDLEGTLWLETYLQRYRHTLVLISHDRDLLNVCVDRILHLDQMKLVAYQGGYDQFERQRAQKAVLASKLKEKQDARRKHMEAFVERFRYKASKARQAQSRLKALEKMGAIAQIADEESAPITFAEPLFPLSPPMIRMEDASVGYEPGKAILRALNLRIDPDDRIGLLGANGNGKSTFAKLLAGRLAAAEGTVTTASKLKVAYFAQHQLDELNPNETPIEQVARLMPHAPPSKVRARVDQMGLPTNRMDTPTSNLSGGEKARLLLGLATFDGPHIIILDEPTNHLDVDSRQALMDAVNGFSGAVLLISHDRRLLEGCADRLWLVAEGSITPYDGDMADYRRLVLGKGPLEKSPVDKQSPTALDKPAVCDKRAPSGKGATGDKTVSGQPSVQGPAKRKEAADRRAALAPLRKKISEAEKRMGDLQKEIGQIDARLADPDLFATDPDKGAALAKKRADSERLLTALEEEWLFLSQDYESQMS